MKIAFKILSIALFCSALACVSNPSEENTADNSSQPEAVAESASGNTYGEGFSKEGAVDIKLLSSKLEGVDSLEIKLVGTINSTCAAKGCWMKMAMSEDEEVRVSFKDYGFFVPTSGVEGKTATINGFAKKVVTDVETLKHFAEDAGKSQEEIDAITEPKEEITFVASGVLIEDSE